MLGQKYVFLPGQKANDDVAIYDVENEKIGYKRFKDKFAESFKYLNLNYPSILIDNRKLDCQIISFFRNLNFAWIARTMLIGRDSANRYMPITEILIGTKLSREDLILSDEYPNGIELPHWPQRSKVNSMALNDIKLKDTNLICKINDWDYILDKYTMTAMNCFFDSRARSGINITFERRHKHCYDFFRYVSDRKYRLPHFLLLLSIYLKRTIHLLFTGKP